MARIKLIHLDTCEAFEAYCLMTDNAKHGGFVSHNHRLFGMVSEERYNDRPEHDVLKDVFSDWGTYMNAFIFPPKMPENLLRAWESMGGDRDFLCRELIAMNRVEAWNGHVISRKEYRRAVEDFMRQLFMHRHITGGL